MNREFKSYIFQCYILLLCITFFVEKVSSNKYHYCAIFVQCLSAYGTTDRSKKRLVKDYLY